MWPISKTFSNPIVKQFIVMGTCLALALMAGCAVKPQISAVVVNDRLSTTGVALVRGDTTLTGVEGTELEVGDMVSTGPGEEAVLLLESGKVEVTLFENTRVRISSVNLLNGDLVVKVIGKLKEIFQVETEFGNAASESTIYYVSLRDNADLRVVGIEGVVRYYPPDNSPSVPLSARQEATWNQTVATPLRQNNVDVNRYNGLIKRINEVERVYKQNDAKFILPDTIGLRLADAENLLRNEGFRVGEAIPILSDQPLGTVVKTRPSVGQLVKLTSQIILSFAEEATTIPNLTGMYEAEARNTLIRARLKVGSIALKITGRFNQGQVVDQEIKPGRAMAVGSRINLTIEADSISVPNVLGMSRESATRTLKDSGLRVGKVNRTFHLNIRSDVVSNQSIRASKLIAPGSKVDLTIKTRGATVPNLIGKTNSEARKIVSRDFYLSFDSKKDGTIVNQSPPAYSVVEPGTTLNLNIKENELPYVE